MRVLVTGHEGYIGAVLTPMLTAAGHEPVGLDTGFYVGCDFGPAPEPIATIERDIRDVEASDLDGFDAVIHLAAISNDPIGDLNPNRRMPSTPMPRSGSPARPRPPAYPASCSPRPAASTGPQATDRSTSRPPSTR